MPNPTNGPPAASKYHSTVGPETTSPVNMSTKLCGVCNGIFTGLLVVGRDMPHHQSVAKLKQSAVNGCQICSFVTNSLRSANEDMRNLSRSGNTSFTWKISLGMFGYSLPWHGCGPAYDPCRGYGSLHITSRAYEVELRLKLMETSGPAAPIHLVSPSASVTDQAVLETPKSWLQNCRQSHPLCGAVDPAFNPTRLIYIHDASSVQLIETKNEANVHAYVAFSHCWGKIETLKLLQDDPDNRTKGNIQDLRSLIQVERLPTSYREAISVSLALGFRHIWIDSLCIIQNSHDDWVRESAMMMDVYSNCSLNLCASAAKSASEASFQDRSWGGAVLDVIPRWTGIVGGRFELAPLPSPFPQVRLLDGNMYTSAIYDSPLNRRAWVVQERILSRRRLYMTRNQLWWECRNLFACEMFPSGVPDSWEGSCGETLADERHLFYALTYHTNHSVHQGTISNGSSAPPTELAGGHFRVQREPSYFEKVLWESLVDRYSRCDLTYPSDKLPALSGLAQIFSIIGTPRYPLAQDSYLAGIWRPYLPFALCWFSPSRGAYIFPMPPSNRPHPYVAPSWSWASTDGSMESKRDFDKACSVVDVKVVPEDERYPTGAVKGGILHLRCRPIGPFTYTASKLKNLAPSPHENVPLGTREAICHVVESHNPKHSCDWDEHNGHGKCWVSYFDQLPHDVHENGIVKGTGATRKKVFVNALAEEPRIRLYFVPIVQTEFDYGMRYRGLILCQVSNNDGPDGFCEETVFQRAGFCRTIKVEKEVFERIPERTIAII